VEKLAQLLTQEGDDTRERARVCGTSDGRHQRFAAGDDLARELSVLTTPETEHRLPCASPFLVLSASTFMTHVNVITDIELDRTRTAQLWQWISVTTLLRYHRPPTGLGPGLAVPGQGEAHHDSKK
jgi:hypothetical protein